MFNGIFIGNILDLFNHSLSNYHLLIKSCQIHLFVILLILSIADYYDLKFGIIPNKLSLILLIYGLLFNFILSVCFSNYHIFIFSIALTALITVISFILWHIGFWGGGDFKLFIGLSLALSFLDLNIFNLNYFSNLNLQVFNQLILYPKAISILLNGILIALIMIFISIIYDGIRNKKIKYYSKLSILDFSSAFNKLTTKTVAIGSLREGMILNDYYFKNQIAYDRINELKNKSNSNINLKAFKDENIYCFSSLNSMGLTKEDIRLINGLYKMDLIKNPDFRVKVEIPFMPFITLGYIGFLIFGDFISIISGFIKMIF
ncbi:A24 family peptidase [uncultured Methanobrevibacter sp.]|uniref:A24 family peptidase n=1 Tax=uncultured Methanobrevibacter sp. TaxID=253161 RepID=UPI00260BB604|nr:A24 family peptidase [uncultured Methanobrevibacter sp.]